MPNKISPLVIQLRERFLTEWLSHALPPNLENEKKMGVLRLTYEEIGMVLQYILNNIKSIMQEANGPRHQVILEITKAPWINDLRVWTSPKAFNALDEQRAHWVEFNIDDIYANMSNLDQRRKYQHFAVWLLGQPEALQAACGQRYLITDAKKTITIKFRTSHESAE